MSKRKEDGELELTDDVEPGEQGQLIETLSEDDKETLKLVKRLKKKGSEASTLRQEMGTLKEEVIARIKSKSKNRNARGNIYQEIDGLTIEISASKEKIIVKKVRRKKEVQE